MQQWPKTLEEAVTRLKKELGIKEIIKSDIINVPAIKNVRMIYKFFLHQ